MLRPVAARDGHAWPGLAKDDQRLAGFAPDRLSLKLNRLSLKLNRLSLKLNRSEARHPAELAIAGVAETRHDERFLVETFVDRRCH